jgi:hypothetical protein
MGKEHKSRKDFTIQQQEAYLLRKARESDALIPEDREKGIKRSNLKRR